jgi:hypothetical protein
MVRRANQSPTSHSRIEGFAKVSKRRFQPSECECECSSVNKTCLTAAKHHHDGPTVLPMWEVHNCCQRVFNMDALRQFGVSDINAFSFPPEPSPRQTPIVNPLAWLRLSTRVTRPQPILYISRCLLSRASSGLDGGVVTRLFCWACVELQSEHHNTLYIPTAAISLRLVRKANQPTPTPGTN